MVGRSDVVGCGRRDGRLHLDLRQIVPRPTLINECFNMCGYMHTYFLCCVSGALCNIHEVCHPALGMMELCDTKFGDSGYALIE